MLCRIFNIQQWYKLPFLIMHDTGRMGLMALAWIWYGRLLCVKVFVVSAISLVVAAVMQQVVKVVQ